MTESVPLWSLNGTLCAQFELQLVSTGHIEQFVSLVSAVLLHHSIIYNGHHYYSSAFAHHLLDTRFSFFSFSFGITTSSVSGKFFFVCVSRFVFSSPIGCGNIMLFPGVVHTFLLSRGGELTHVHHLSLSSIISRCAADLLFKHGWITKLVAKRFSFFYTQDFLQVLLTLKGFQGRV